MEKAASKEAAFFICFESQCCGLVTLEKVGLIVRFKFLLIQPF